MIRALLIAMGFLSIGRADASVLSASECSALESRLANGDILFIAINNTLYSQVARAQESWATHVGLAFQVDGEWKVAESTIPWAKWTPLCQFLGRTKNKIYLVRRPLEPLTSVEQQGLKQAAESMMGQVYNLGFNYDGIGQFCSKFVYEAYAHIGRKVGKIETLKNLRDANTTQDDWFWKLWYLGSVPWDQRTVTPKSLALDPEYVDIERTDGGDFSDRVLNQAN